MAVILALAFVHGCDCAGGDEREAVQTHIRQTVAERTELPVQSVTCPEEAEASRVVCTAVLDDMTSIPVPVTATDEGDRSYDWTALNRWKIESQVGAAIRERWPELGITAFACEPDGTIDPGTTVGCTATLEDAAPIEVLVTITDDGSIRYETRGVVHLPALEEEILDRLEGREASVDCGGTVRYAPPDTTFDCDLEYPDGDTGRAVVTVRDWKGNVAWVIH